jgi:hypothetical protein
VPSALAITLSLALPPVKSLALTGWAGAPDGSTGFRMPRVRPACARRAQRGRRNRPPRGPGYARGTLGVNFQVRTTP